MKWLMIISNVYAFISCYISSTFQYIIKIVYKCFLDLYVFIQASITTTYQPGNPENDTRVAELELKIKEMETEIEELEEKYDEELNTERVRIANLPFMQFLYVFLIVYPIFPNSNS